MNISDCPFTVIDWSAVERASQPGQTGLMHQRVTQLGNVRVRVVEYAAGYSADHWCEKGHVILVLAGELRTTLRDGTTHVLKQGMSYQVADGAMAHRSSTTDGATLFIVD
jgi:quercetin dioxygenase-like cupin family protein